MQDRVLLHLHIPKTGGSSLVKFLQRQYGDEFLRVPNPKALCYWETVSDLTQYRCISGHFVYPSTPIDDVVYLTFVREPLDRLLSLYHYFTYNSGKGYRPELEELGFERFIGGDFGDEELEKEIRHFVDNDMTRRISGVDKSVHRVDGLHLERALLNLISFAPVGLTERYDESLSRWAELFGWGEITPLSVDRLLYQPDRMKREDLPSYLVERVRRLNKFDYYLYNFILRRDWQSEFSTTV